MQPNRIDYEVSNLLVPNCEEGEMKCYLTNIKSILSKEFLKLATSKNEPELDYEQFKQLFISIRNSLCLTGYDETVFQYTLGILDISNTNKIRYDTFMNKAEDLVFTCSILGEENEVLVRNAFCEVNAKSQESMSCREFRKFINTMGDLMNRERTLEHEFEILFSVVDRNKNSKIEPIEMTEHYHYIMNHLFKKPFRNSFLLANSSYKHFNELVRNFADNSIFDNGDFIQDLLKNFYKLKEKKDKGIRKYEVKASFLTDFGHSKYNQIADLGSLLNNIPEECIHSSILPNEIDTSDLVTDPPQELLYQGIFNKDDSHKTYSENYLKKLNLVDGGFLFNEKSDTYAYLETAYYYHLIENKDIEKPLKSCQEEDLNDTKGKLLNIRTTLQNTIDAIDSFLDQTDFVASGHGAVPRQGKNETPEIMQRKKVEGFRITIPSIEKNKKFSEEIFQSPQMLKIQHSSLKNHDKAISFKGKYRPLVDTTNANKVNKDELIQISSKKNLHNVSLSNRNTNQTKDAIYMPNIAVNKSLAEIPGPLKAEQIRGTNFSNNKGNQKQVLFINSPNKSRRKLNSSTYEFKYDGIQNSANKASFQPFDSIRRNSEEDPSYLKYRSCKF